MEALAVSLRVIWAVMLRDLRTRFFNHGLGYLVALAFPLGHCLILLGVWTLLGRPAPYGDSAVVFFGTALAPFMSWLYMSRYIMLSLLMNRPLLAFPAVKLLDIVFGRAALETLGSCAMVAVLAGLGVIWGLDIAPRDIVEMTLALGVALLMGLGFGLVSALLALAMPAWVTIYVLLQVVLYFASGIIFFPPALPEWARALLSWVPTLHLVEWMRVAYFEGYPADLLDRGYALRWAVGSIGLGLALERAIRGRLLGG